MAEDWASDVLIYAPNADPAVIAAIVRYCGIALRSRDASLVSFSDPVETGRVRENFLKKKLALTQPDSELDAAIAAVGAKMSGDPTKNRVTVYYLLADHFGLLGMFGGSAAMPADAVVAPAPAAPAPAQSTPLPLAAAMPVAAAPVAAVPVAKHENRRVAGSSGYGEYAPMVLLLLSGAGLFWWITSAKPAAAPVAAPVAVVAAPVVAAPAIPDGQGLINQEVDGKPMLQVYFDTAKTDVSPDIVPAAGELKAYLDEHPGSTLAVSGYNDPRGDAAMNAELSKNRAMAVRDALAANGIALTIIELVKPADTSDTGTTMVQARRVDVTVK